MRPYFPAIGRAAPGQVQFDQIHKLAPDSTLKIAKDRTGVGNSEKKGYLGHIESTWPG
jgi:hypothetical protein